MIDDDKRAAAAAAVEEVRAGMCVGLGTGSTAAHAVRLLGERVTAGLSIRAVATSEATARLAASCGITVTDFADVARIDLAIDGADEIDEGLRAIKGAGGAMLREKVVAAAADRMIVIADASKRRASIGGAPVPVELLPFARAFTVAKLQALGASVVVRSGYRTDGGNLVADCTFATMPDPEALARAIAAIPGALGHGLFLSEVDAAYIGADGIVTRLERSAGSR
ncbi:ribose-5-phosphate isomerase RpiA [Sphingomonas sp.]|uniref:ribose-5-phosphate isomerase RpiA n=1 Tax=Sphingomonas sp. TaxID=28214 RepID=UPI0035BC4312